MNPIEAEIIARIANNNGFLNPYEFGAYRPKNPHEKVDPSHVEKINGTPYVPVLIYGLKPPEAQDNRKISPMPSHISLKHTGNNLLPTI